MARSLAFVPTATPGVSALVALDDIPQDVKDEVEEVYRNLKANPNGRIRAEFDDASELRMYVTHVTSYCEQRQVNGEAAPLRFRKSPTKNLPANKMDFRITDPKTENEQITEDIRSASATAGNTAASPASTRKTAKR